MEFMGILGGIIFLLILYFFFGALLKFLWGWMPLVLGSFVSIIFVMMGGAINAIIALVIFIVAIGLTNSWQGQSLYFRVEEKIEQMFYFKD